jgi:serine/threonine-protein kinase
MNLPVGHYLQNKKYQLLQVVGQGGFGITYKGILFAEVKGALGTIKTEVPIGIKEYFFKDYCYRDTNGVSVNVHSETGQLLFRKFREKLIKEAKILSDVHHPHIVHVLDVFEENNTAYIAMEYIAGHSLKHILERDGVLAEGKVLKYTHQIGQALQFVHEKNILHLDIKPSNILIDKNDNAHLIDFGVSKRYDMENTETSTTMLTLSKGFASIEQYDNEGTHLFSPCPDVYSLGATMYNLLTGKIPTESILRATRVFANPSELNPAITSETEKAILKAMQINPADRFQTMQELLAALAAPPVEEKTTPRPAPEPALSGEEADEETIFRHPATPPSDKPAPRAPDKKKRRKGVLLVALICIFAVVGTSVAIFLGEENTEINLPPAVLTEEEPAGQEPEKDKTLATDSPQDNRQPALSPPAGGARPEPETPSQQPTAEDLDAEYEAWIEAGKAKMNAGDYTGADEAFSKAIFIKATDEAKQLLIANASRMEEKQIADRIAQYEEKASFGKYKIVRNKVTKKYGAIDSKGEERIPCKYVYVGIAGENRAFQREDNVFDIYNADATLIRSDVTY